MVICGADVCCRVVFGTMVSVMWSELLMISAISCPLWSESGVYVHISDED